MLTPSPLTLVPVHTTREGSRVYCQLLTLQAERGMLCDFGNYAKNSSSGSLTGTIFAIDVYLAYFV